MPFADVAAAPNVQEHMYGGTGNDLLYGSHKVTGAAYKLFGDAGDDKIIGGEDVTTSANHNIYGMDGNDQVYGGDGTTAIE